jgi:5'(3')-deoxyribonucleotidase
MSARRYTDGKIRYELIPNEFKEALAKVYTIGAEKYTLRDEKGNITEDGANNWRKGLGWKQTLGAIYRHLEKFERGEDYDYDYPKELLDKYGPSLHLANAAWGISTLITQYKIHPQLDDRIHPYLSTKRIALDIDDVLADWAGEWAKLHGIQRPTSWAFDRAIMQKFDAMQYHGTLEDFYANLPVLTRPEDIPFEPVAYVTSRPVPSAITEAWLDKNGFPAAPVYTVGLHGTKVEVLRDIVKADIFVDDRWDNFLELNKAGIFTYLFDAPHNTRYDVGHRRIFNLKDLT